MTEEPTYAYKYQGGSLSANDPTYVMRKADDVLSVNQESPAFYAWGVSRTLSQFESRKILLHTQLPSNG